MRADGVVTRLASTSRVLLAVALSALLVGLTAIPPLTAAPPAVASGHGDPLRSEQWGLDRVRIDQAWSRSRGDGAVVAVIDTGVALDHPDLVDRFVRTRDGEVLGLDLVDGRSPQDTHGHGTLVAGIIAATADNGEGIAGVAPEARVLPIRVLDGRGAGVGGDVDRAIRWAVDRGADVINLSLEAAPMEAGTQAGPAVPTAAVRYAADAGVVVVVATGNSSGSAAAYPDDTPALLVGAVDRDDRPATFSEVGRTDAVLAPGVGIVSTWCQRTSSGCDVAPAPYGVAEGTSFAAPYVSGIAALLAARGVPADEIVRRIRDTAVDLGPPGPDQAHGAGRVDASAALAGVRVARAEPAPAPPATPSPAPSPAPDPDLPTVDEPLPPAAPPAEEPSPVEDEPEPVPSEPEPEPIEPADDPEPDPAPVAEEPRDPDPSAAPLAGQTVSMDTTDGGGLRTPELLAAGLLLLTMSLWSRAARRWEVA